ncbi:MAG: NAD(P)/FAD-dependent oxidoreductase [Thiotrichales bacterium]
MSDCIIVGGGISGLLCARLLADHGLRVSLFDRIAFGRESSWAGGGILSPLYPWRYPDAVNALAEYSQSAYPELATELRDETGIDPEWERSGILVVDAEPAADAWARRWNLALERIPDAAVVAAIQPGLAVATSELAWMPEIAQIRNPRLMKALLASIARRPSITCHPRSAVDEIVIEHGRVRGVRAGDTTHAGERVLITAGAWSKSLVPSGGGAQPEIFPVKGQMIVLQTAPGTLVPMVLRAGRYLIPRRDGLVLVGSTLEHADYDKSTDRAARDSLAAFAAEAYPALAEAPVVQHWAGLRPGAPDGVPYVGALPQAEGLYINAGHYRNGVVMGLGAAQLAVDLLLNRPPCVDSAPYAPTER